MALDEAAQLAALMKEQYRDAARLDALMKGAERYLEDLSSEELDLRRGRALPILSIVVLTPLMLGAWLFDNESAIFFAWLLGLSVLWALVLTDRRQQVERHIVGLEQKLSGTGCCIRWAAGAGSVSVEWRGDVEGSP